MIMKKHLLSCFLLMLLFQSYGQQYNRNKLCGTDTVAVDYVHRMTGQRIQYKAFSCTQASALGIRFDVGFNTYAYNARTRSWLGNHNGALFGLALVYKNFNLGFSFKPATVNPQTALMFNGDTLGNNADLNPIKIQCDLGYSIDFLYNFSVEPFIGFTRHSFHVINEKDLNKNYIIRKAFGVTTGVTLHKYFRLKELKFMSLFVKYGYGFADFKRTHPQLGAGYSDLSFGISYKAFYKRKFLQRIK